MFGVYESGPWLAFKFSNDPFPGWIGGGTELFNMMVKNTRADNAQVLTIALCIGVEALLPELE